MKWLTAPAANYNSNLIGYWFCAVYLWNDWQLLQLIITLIWLEIGSVEFSLEMTDSSFELKWPCCSSASSDQLSNLIWQYVAEHHPFRFKHVFSIKVENKVDSDQVASYPNNLDLHSFQKEINLCSSGQGLTLFMSLQPGGWGIYCFWCGSRQCWCWRPIFRFCALSSEPVAWFWPNLHRNIVGRRKSQVVFGDLDLIFQVTGALWNVQNMVSMHYLLN